jgi:hypothetical protein
MYLSNYNKTTYSRGALKIKINPSVVSLSNEGDVGLFLLLIQQQIFMIYYFCSYFFLTYLARRQSKDTLL